MEEIIKYFATGPGRQYEIKVGDKIRVDGDLHLATTAILEWLCQEKILTKQVIRSTGTAASTVPSTATPNTEVKSLAYYVQKAADRMGWKFEKMDNYLTTLDEFYSSVAFNIILREIAVDLDKQYPDHINKSEKIYVINSMNGKITEVFPATIKNFRNFAAFRTIDDAKKACSILRLMLKKMFSNNNGK